MQMRNAAILIFSSAVLVVATALVTTKIADVRSQNVNRTLQYVQGVLAYNHYKQYKEVKELVARTCYEAARERAAFYEQQELNLLAESLRPDNSRGLRDYVKERDPDVIKRVDEVRLPLHNETVTFSPCNNRN
jgi:hypothetical protein